MKTILINPPQNTKYPQPPLGLASIAAVLEQDGHTVEILDANALHLNGRKITKNVKNADAIGITAMTPAVNSAIRIAREIKRENPELTRHAVVLFYGAGDGDRFVWIEAWIEGYGAEPACKVFITNINYYIR